MQPARVARVSASVEDERRIAELTADLVCHRIRGGFRLAGLLATVAIGFLLSLATLQASRGPMVMVIPVPFLASWLLGNVVAYAYRVDARRPKIPTARVLRRT